MDYTQRSPILDNAKYLMIFIVVLGHAIGPFIYSFPTLKMIFTCLYIFHMPVFIIISGMLSRDVFSLTHIKKLIRTLFVPFIIFTLIYEISHFIMFDETSKYLRWHIPYWLLWYLPSLFFWRLTLPFVSKIPLFLLISFIGAILIGFVPDAHKMYGFSRTLYFWPFFLIGYILTPDLFENKIWRKIPKFIWALLVLGLISQTWLNWDLNHKFLYGNLPYGEFKIDAPTAAITRIMILLTSVIISLAVMGLVPRKLPFISNWKPNTLSIYLWHGIAINILIASGFRDIMKTWSLASISTAILLFTIILVVLLSSQYVTRITRYITFQPIIR